MPLKNINTGREFSDEMNNSSQRLQALISKRLPERVKDELQKVVDSSFQNEQYQEKKSSKWKGRKKDSQGSLAREERRALLVKSGKMIAAAEAEVINSDTIAMRVNDAQASVYAPVHNEGLKAGRGAGFQMPKRQFMPIPGEANQELDSKVEKWMDDEMDKIFK
jgi:phage gpG-like protein